MNSEDDVLSEEYCWKRLKDIESFKPIVVLEKYGLMLIELKKCYVCHKHMIRRDDSWTSPFPRWVVNTLESQAKRADWVIQSTVKVDDNYICLDCERAGKADFKCYLCKNRYSSTNIEERFGDPPEFLCKHCYETVSAKIWDKTNDYLLSIHKHDFE